MLKRKMEDLHFANMVQFEATMKQEVIKRHTLNDQDGQMCFADGHRKSSVPNNRMAQTIEHEPTADHNHSIQVIQNGERFQTLNPGSPTHS